MLGALEMIKIKAYLFIFRVGMQETRQGSIYLQYPDFYGIKTFALRAWSAANLSLVRIYYEAIYPRPERDNVFSAVQFWSKKKVISCMMGFCSSVNTVITAEWV